MRHIIEFLGEYPFATASGIVATILMLWVLRGMVPLLLYRNRRLAWHLVLAVSLLMVGSFGRSIYWEGTSLILDGDARRAFRLLFGGMNINLVFNTLLIWSSLHWLKFLHLLIPASQRDAWSMWTAPCWPNRSLWPGSLEALRDIWRQRRD